MAMNINIRAGTIVQNSSMFWASRKYRLKGLNEDIVSDIMVRVVTMVKIIKVWSWKNTKCSISGEFLFWVLSFIHTGIF